MLIIINNISIINDYFYEDKIIKKINICNANNQYCLSYILYYLNQFIWYNNISLCEEELYNKYIEFINCYSKTNSNYKTPEKYCHEIQNIELIIKFIYTKINDEFTQINKDLNKKNSNFYLNDPLSIYIWNFSQNNKSIISDHFFGFYQYQIYCKNCERNCYFKNNRDYKSQISYDSFSYINFELNTICEYKSKQINNYNYQYNNFNSFHYNNYYNYKQNINLNDCFDFSFRYNNKKWNYNSYCSICSLLSNIEKSYSIFSLPSILTISLSNNNCNFIIQDELDLKPYSMNVPFNSDGIYILISLLCKISYSGEYICYCANPNNGLWYSYSNKKIKNVEKMDINAVPLILVYQIRNSIEFEYKEIKKDNNIIKLNLKFMNQLSPKEIYFNKNIKIKDVIKEIKQIFFTGNDYKISLVISGRILSENQCLYEAINNSNDILVINFKNN